MKINRAFAAVLALALAVAGCAAPPPPKPQAPRPAPSSPPPPPPAAASPRPADWRDAPQTPGTWRYGAAPAGGTARFGDAGTAPLVTLACDRARRTVSLIRAGSAAGPVPASLTSSSGTVALGATPLPEGLALAFPASDSRLDALAFSRGRFVVEIGGLAPLYLPAWPEVGRVIEDCRR